MFKKYYLLGSITLFFLSGCTGLPLNKKVTDPHDPVIKDHVIAIGKDGELKDPLTGEAITGHEKEQYLNNIINKIKQHSLTSTNDKAKLLIYAHGGLNRESNGLKRALENYRAIKANGHYPVFINWRSGPATTYFAHLWKIRQGEQSDTAWATSPVYLATDVGKSIINAPKAWLVSGEHMLDSTIFQEYESLVYCNNGKKNVRCSKNETDFWNIKRKMGWLLTSPSKIISAPFTYTMAKPAWDIMLRRTNTLFYTPEDLELQVNTGTPQKENEKFGTPGNGALYQFLSKLKDALHQKNYRSKIEIDLIGHSMGAIIVNNIINNRFDLPYKNIVHMASADSIKNLFDQVIPYLSKEENKEVQFYSLALHPKNEDRETSAFGLTPSGSLLTWIDNKYTVPETVMSKRSGRWDNMARALDLLPKEPSHVRCNMHFTIFGIQDRRKCTKKELKILQIKGLSNAKEKELYCTAQAHGDFDELPFWLPTVWKGTHLNPQGE